VPPRSVIFVPAGTAHQNYPRTPKTRILTISVSDSQVAQAADYVRLPETESDFRHGEIASLALRQFEYLALECGIRASEPTQRAAVVSGAKVIEPDSESRSLPGSRPAASRPRPLFGKTK
jgi:hypothetical protein